MLEAVGESLSKGVKLPRKTAMIVVGCVTFAVSLFLESLPAMGSWLDAVTIYIAPFGAVLAAVMIYWVLGLKAIRAELMEGRTRPLGPAFGFLAKYVYVFLSAAVLVLGIVYGGIG